MEEVEEVEAVLLGRKGKKAGSRTKWPSSTSPRTGSAVSTAAACTLGASHSSTGVPSAELLAHERSKEVWTPPAGALAQVAPTFTCFTGSRVQILTGARAEEQAARRAAASLVQRALA